MKSFNFLPNKHWNYTYTAAALVIFLSGAYLIYNNQSQAEYITPQASNGTLYLSGVSVQSDPKNKLFQPFLNFIQINISSYDKVKFGGYITLVTSLVNSDTYQPTILQVTDLKPVYQSDTKHVKQYHITAVYKDQPATCDIYMLAYLVDCQVKLNKEKTHTVIQLAKYGLVYRDSITYTDPLSTTSINSINLELQNKAQLDSLVRVLQRNPNSTQDIEQLNATLTQLLSSSLKINNSQTIYDLKRIKEDKYLSDSTIQMANELLAKLEPGYSQTPDPYTTSESQLHTLIANLDDNTTNVDPKINQIVSQLLEQPVQSDDRYQKQLTNDLGVILEKKKFTDPFLNEEITQLLQKLKAAPSPSPLPVPTIKIHRQPSFPYPVPLISWAKSMFGF